MIPRALAAGQPKAPLPRRGTDAITLWPDLFRCRPNESLTSRRLAANT